MRGRVGKREVKPPIRKPATDESADLTSIASLPLAKSLAKKLAPPTKAQIDLTAAAAAIAAQPDDVERVFMARQLVLCTLPHSNPGNDSPRWLRRTGNSSLIIQPGWNAETDESIGYPFGIIPRLVLFWIATEVQKTKNREDMTEIEKRTLHPGRSLSDFLRAVGLSPLTGRGKRGDGKRLQDQLDRLFSARISFQETLTNLHAKGRRDSDMTVAPERELWWDSKRPDQGALWMSWIELGENFYRELCRVPVPVDMRALRALKRSSLALDLYALVCYVVFVITQKSLSPQFFAWKVLMRQLGTDYTDSDDFKKAAQGALRKIKKVYPGLIVTSAKGGFKVHASRLAVPQKTGTKSIG